MRQKSIRGRTPDNPQMNLITECKDDFVPGEGLQIFFSENQSVIFGMLIGTKEGYLYTDQELLYIAAIFQEGEYVDDYDVFDANAANGRMIEALSDGTRVVSPLDFKSFGDKFIYKFVSEENYEKYIMRGKFKLGDLRGYRDLEKVGHEAGDRREGRTVICTRFAGRDMAFLVNAGRDYAIFSASHDLSTKDFMKSKFGNVVLKINLRKFCKSVQNKLECPYPEIRKIFYTNLKVQRFHGSKHKCLYDFPNVSGEFVKCVEKFSRISSLFAKPVRFISEREVRLAFPMGKDIDDSVYLDLPDFQEYVERIE